jgi:transposase
MRRTRRPSSSRSIVAKKTGCGECGTAHRGFYDRQRRRARDLRCGGRAVYLDYELRRVECKKCGGVKQENLSFLSPNKKFTQLFALQIGGLCRVMTVQDVARRMQLDWDTVKDLDQIYMREQLKRAGRPDPRAIGVDEISIKKGHKYRIVVSDLDRKRAIWFGGTGRTEADMDLFYAFLGKENSDNIKIAVMDMGKPFRHSTQHHAPQAAIVFDKFHLLRHLGEALDDIRRAEYKRVVGDQRKFIKGQRYVLLSRRENLTDDGKKNLRVLLKANKRLNTAYLLREQFEQLWDYASAAWARKFFDNWKKQLRWQRLAPYEKFARMIERHWEGIAAYCNPDNKVALGFVEGLNNKIRVIQRRAYGLRDEEYLKLKILTTSLPEL